MRSFGIAAAACALALSAGLPTAALSQDAADQTPALEQNAQRKPAPRYFIDFRSRSALSYGHTYVVFGRVGEKLTGKNVAGLHPRGDSSLVYMLGHVLMVPAETGISDGDLEKQYTTANYRVMLTAAQYRTVVAHIRDLQANSPMWNAATYNCNAFVGTIAHFVGLVSPPTWLLPQDFVNSMRQINEGRTYAMTAAQSGSPATARAVQSVRGTQWGADRRHEARRAMARASTGR